MRLKSLIVITGSALGIALLAGLAPQDRTTATAPTAVAEDAAVTKYNIDPVHSSIVYKIRHMGIANFYGRFNKLSGDYAFAPTNPEAGHFNITIDATSVDSNNAQRDEHLRSPDFFNTKEYPTITFKSTGVKKVSSNEFELTGDLTLHGVTNRITVPLEWIGTAETRGGMGSGFDVVFTIKRTDYGMDYGVSQGALGDEVTIMLGIEGKSQ